MYKWILGFIGLYIFRLPGFFIGLFIANYTIDVLVGSETFDAWMTSSAYVVVLLAALIAVMPGCGGMIAVAVSFITIPNFPMAALIAAAGASLRREEE